MMNDEDLMNDALDAQIQAAIGRSRGNMLQGMAQPHGGGQAVSDHDADDQAGTLAMMAEDDDEDDKKKQGGGGLGGILGMVGGMVGG